STPTRCVVFKCASDGRNARTSLKHAAPNPATKRNRYGVENAACARGGSDISRYFAQSPQAWPSLSFRCGSVEQNTRAKSFALSWSASIGVNALGITG